MPNSNNWILDFLERAKAANDEKRQRLVFLWYQASTAGVKDTQFGVLCLDAARALAAELEESWWLIELDSLRINALVRRLFQCQAGLDLAIKTALETRKPQYQHLPQRICVHERLASAFAGIDPIGHADAIEQALDYAMTALDEIGDPALCKGCVLHVRADILMDSGRYADAAVALNQLMALSDEPDYTAWRGSGLYWSQRHAWCVRDWDRLERLARTALAELDTTERRDQGWLAAQSHLAWCELRRGDTAQAQPRIEQTLSAAAEFEGIPSPSFYDAIGACLEFQGRLDEALRLYDTELAPMLRGGMTHFEIGCRLKRRRVLTALGRLSDADEETRLIEAAYLKLKRPTATRERFEAEMAHPPFGRSGDGIS